MLVVINLFLTNKPYSFQNTMTISTGLSDFHKMILTVLKSTFVKAAPKVKSWTLFSRHMRNVVEKCFSANVPKVLIFVLLLRTETINDFSY